MFVNSDNGPLAAVPVAAASAPAGDPSLEKKLAARQVQHLYEQAPLLVLLGFLAMLGTVAVYWPRAEVSHTLLLGWGGAFLTLCGLRTLLIHHFLHAPGERDTPFWDHLSLLGSLGTAALWAVAAIAFNPKVLPVSDPGHFYHQPLFGALVCSQAIAAVAGYAANYRTLVFYLLFSLGPGIIYMAASGGQFGMAVALIGIVFLGFLLLSGRRIFTMTQRALRLALKNEALIQFLESSKADAVRMNQQLASEIYDRKQAEARLQDSKETLERKVLERTEALSGLNRALRQSQERLTLAIEAAGIGLWDWRLPTDEIYHSNFDQLLGYSSREVTGFMGHLKPLVHPDDYGRVKRAIVSHLRGRTDRYEVSYRMRHRDGRWVWVEDNGRVVARNEAGEAVRMIGTRRDITEDRAIEEKLRLAASVFDNATEAIFILDRNLRFLAVNPLFTEVTGFSEAETQQQSILELRPTPESLLDKYEEIRRALHQRGQWQGEFEERRKNGEAYPQWLRMRAVRDDQDQITHYVGLFSDLTAKREAEEKLRYLANYDRLTGFANRNQFRDRLHTALARARDGRHDVALLHIDLDRFRQINDTLGHEIGDELLREAAKRLSSLDTQVDTLARLGSDEFAIILDGYEDRAEIEHLCERIIAELRRPFRLGEHELLLGASIGIALFPDNGRELQLLLNHADTAMQSAKRVGGNSYRFYTENLRVASIEQLNLENSLRKAIFRDEFVVHYQPKMCLKTERIIGVEALVRWNHPSLGLLSPAEFMPLAEETGLVTAISEMVLDKACRQTKFWDEAGFGRIRTSVNLAAHQLRKGNLLSIVRRVLDHSGLDPELLEFELTESTLMDDVEQTIETLHSLRAMGIELSLDDFGTGYSSLGYLKRFPIDIIKIDQAFIRDIGTSADDEAITRAIIAMAHSMSMKVVAEGVETATHLDFLRREGCDYIQGFFLSRPVPEAELSDLLRKQQVA